MNRPSPQHPSPWTTVGALLAGLAVALGAFGAHLLSDQLTAARMATFETAVRYQFLHALALLLLGNTRILRPPEVQRIGVLLLFGTLVFSGSLYLLVATHLPLFGATAPIGGGALLLGWGAWAWAARPTRGAPERP